MKRPDLSKINELHAQLAELRDATHDRVEIQTILLLLGVARGQHTAGELAKSLNVSSAAVSRNITRLSDRATRSGQGYGFVTIRPDPMDYRNKVIELSPKGADVLARVFGSVES